MGRKMLHLMHRDLENINYLDKNRLLEKKIRSQTVMGYFLFQQTQYIEPMLD